MKFHLKIDPDTLDDDKWAQSWADLRFALNFEAERTTKDLKG